MSDMNTHISMDKLSVGYNGKAIIKDICIDIKRGDIVTLIGPNGAGKSTILKSITRQLATIEGDVVFDEKNIRATSLKELSKKMAVVLTERVKTDLLTCYDIVASGRYPYTGKLGLLTEEDEKKIDEAIAKVNASELGPRDFNNISDGQKQRILLARAICQEPEIIILDEPTSFLDIRYKLELLSILRNMAKEKGITVIMSLHEIDLAEKISDKIICVKGDRIYGYGAPEEIFEDDEIRKIYDIDKGYFDSLFGSIELPAPVGDKLEVFVISSGGSGIPVYRSLQKDNCPFAAGILSNNDIDYRLAKLLALEVVETTPFEKISNEAVDRGMELVESCEKVIFAKYDLGEENRPLEKVITKARELGKLVEI